MRCPECEQRNSVAASKCKFCGAKFKRKTMPMGRKLALAGAAVVLVGAIWVTMMIPKMVDPAEQLAAAAKRMANGPRSPEEATEMRASFDSAVENLLKRYGADSSTILASKLKAILPSSAFEVLVVDLPKGLKLVEIDSILQATDFMVFKGTNEVKVFRLPGFEVYDDAKAVSDQAGPVIVLLGHSGGQPPHRPIVKTYALLPDSIEDETKSMVPSIAGDGTAKFAKDSGDISIELMGASVAQVEKINMAPAVGPDKVVKLQLRWKDAKYQPELSASPDPQSYMLLLARNLRYPEFWPASAAYLGPSASKLLKEHSSPLVSGVSVKKVADKAGVQQFVMQTSNKKFDVDLKPAGNLWQAAGYKVAVIKPTAEDNAAVSATPTPPPVEAVPVQPPPVATNPPAPVSNNPPVQVPVSSAPKVEDPKSKSGNNQVVSVSAKNGSPTKSVLPPNLISAMPGPAAAGSHQQDPHAGSKNAKGTGSSSWLGDDDEKPTHVAAVSPAVKKPDPDKDKKGKEKDKVDKKPADAGKIGQIVENGTSSVRMRSGPGLNKRTVTEIPTGANVSILGEEKGWYKVRYGNRVGYVFQPLVNSSKTAAAAVEPKTEPTKKSSEKNEKAAKQNSKQADKKVESAKATPPQPPKQEPRVTQASGASGSSSVIQRPMNVRDDNRHKIGTVQPGEKVVVLGSMKNERYKIRLSDGRVGWVHKDALGHVSANQIAPDDTPSNDGPPEFVP